MLPDYPNATDVLPTAPFASTTHSVVSSDTPLFQQKGKDYFLSPKHYHILENSALGTTTISASISITIAPTISITIALTITIPLTVALTVAAPIAPSVTYRY